LSKIIIGTIVSYMIVLPIFKAFSPLFLKVLKLVRNKPLETGDTEDFFEILHSGPIQTCFLTHSIF
jgi:hypothetical protein